MKIKKILKMKKRLSIKRKLKIERKLKIRLKRAASTRLNKRLIAILWFLVKFNLLAVPLYALMLMNVSVPALQSFVAAAVHNGLGMLGYDSSLNGHFVTFSSGLSIVNVEMNFDCTGWKSMYALLALCLATPALWKQRLRFLVVGLPAVFIINILRIVTTIAAVMSFGIGYLGIVHSILWQEGLIIAVVAVWYLWLRRINSIL